MTKVLNLDDMTKNYSPPRMVRFTEEPGLTAGRSLDPTVDDQGKPWDLTKKEMRDEAIQLIAEGQPTLAIGSPTCTNPSPMVNINWGKFGEQETKRRLEGARQHLDFCIQIYTMQHEGGRYLLHGHPPIATSLGERGVRNLVGINGVTGMTPAIPEGPKFVKKPTGNLTNPQCIAEALINTCRGDHEHVAFEGENMNHPGTNIPT